MRECLNQGRKMPWLLRDATASSNPVNLNLKQNLLISFFFLPAILEEKRKGMENFIYIMYGSAQ